MQPLSTAYDGNTESLLTANASGFSTQVRPPMALCASYAAGVVCCCAGQGAHLLAFDVRRGLFPTAMHAVDIPTTVGTCGVSRAKLRPNIAPIQALSVALQARLGDSEINTAVTA